jgi:hypothetical protein
MERQQTGLIRLGSSGACVFTIGDRPSIPTGLFDSPLPQVMKHAPEPLHSSNVLGMPALSFVHPRATILSAPSTICRSRLCRFPAMLLTSSCRPQPHLDLANSQSDRARFLPRAISNSLWPSFSHWYMKAAHSKSLGKDAASRPRRSALVFVSASGNALPITSISVCADPAPD